MHHRTARSLLGRALPWAVLLPLLTGGCAMLDAGPTATVANDQASGVMRLARSAESKGDLPTANALYQQAHAANPNSAKPLVALGDVLRAQGSDGQAMEAYRRALALDARQIDALRGMGMAQMQSNDARGALDSFNAALHVDSKDVRAWNGRGVALDMLDRHPEAQHAYRTGLSMKQDDTALLNNIGLSEALAAQTPAAVPSTLAQRPMTETVARDWNGNTRRR